MVSTPCEAIICDQPKALSSSERTLLAPRHSIKHRDPSQMNNDISKYEGY